MRSLAKKIGRKLRTIAKGAIPARGRMVMLFALLLLFSIILILAPKQAHAQTSWFLDDIANKAIGQIFYYIAYIIAIIGGAAIAVIMYFVQIVLAINNHVQDGIAVQTGFSVTLAIANLGFVLAIIVIALATILRSQTYGIKQILWKLVVAAILVNFSLVIAGAIVGVANSFTRYFMTGMPGGGTGVTGFASALAGAFNPHKTLLNFNQDANGGSFTTSMGQNFSGAAAGGLGALIKLVLNLIFIIFFLIAIIITLAVFLVMLIIRYLYLGILMILMPLAWLAWIFPKFQHLWSKWWSTFFRWTFFAPTVVFFLYLAIMTSQAMSNNQAGSPLATADVSALVSNDAAGGGLLSGINNFIGGLAGTVMPTFMQMLLMIGLTIGGMVAANSMSITGASVAVGAARGVGNFTGRWVGKQGKKVASKAVPTSVKERLQKGEIGALGYIPGARRLAGIAGRGLEKVEKVGGSELVDKEAAWAREQAKDSKNGARVLAGSLPPEKRLALAKEMTKNEDLDMVEKINGVDRDKWIADNKKEFHNYGQDKFYEKDLKKSQVNPQEQRTAETAAKNPNEQVPDVNNVMGGGAGKTTEAMKLLDESMKKLALSMEKADAHKIDTNNLFRSKSLLDPATKARLESFLRQTAAYNYELVPGMLNGMKAEQRKNFTELYRNAINTKKNEVQAPTWEGTAQEREETLKRLEKAEELFDSMLINNALYGGGGKSAETQPVATAASQPKPPSPPPPGQ